MPNRYIDPADNPDLTAERKGCQFDTTEFSAVLRGGKEKFADRKRIERFVENTPELKNLSTDTSYGAKIDWVERAFRRHVVAKKYQDQVVQRSNREGWEYYKALTVGVNGAPGGLADVIVIPLLENCCDEKQRKMFLEPARRYQHYSAYAQTELGHGTNTKALGTTATFDPTTQTFVLNTPNLQSYKWWPGNLGKVASWCVVMADLITNGTSHGMHPFYIQIRDENTHQPLPGVTVGETGTNFGAVSNDNGYLALDNVRVPKTAMLAKHFQVKPDGTYVQGVHPRMAYVGMMFVRSVMTKESMGEALAIAATIATRYSCVRRQGEIEPGKGEVKIIEYQTQQYRVFPQIARAICFFLAGDRVTELYFKMCEDLKNGDASLMEDVHALTSGLKAVSSYQASQGVEQCRLACGGHGYSHGSGIPDLYALVVGGCTYEGDNLVMLLQLARYLMKRAKEALTDKKPQNLAKMAEHLFARSKDQCGYSLDQSRQQRWYEIKAAFEHLSRRLTFKASNILNGESKKNSQEVAWNNASVSLSKAAKAFTRVYLANSFVESVVQISDMNVRFIFEDCLDLYLNYELLDCRADLLEDNYVTSRVLDEVQESLLEALQRLRPNAVNIVDSFDFPDRILNSQIGARDGHAYENLYRWAQKSPLNEHQVLPFHHETIGKLMKEVKAASKL